MSATIHSGTGEDEGGEAARAYLRLSGASCRHTCARMSSTYYYG